MAEKYSQKKTFYNPKISSVVLLIIAASLIYLIFKSDSLRNSLIQIFGISNDFMLKHF
jgi:hypothetical protein